MENQPDTFQPPRARELIVAFALLILLCLLGGCATAGRIKADAQPPATPVGVRDAAVEARDSLAVAHLDAALARVVDLRSPEQVGALLKVVRASFSAKPTAADVVTATATVDAIARGDLKAAEDAAKTAAARDAAVTAAVQAERQARARAEQALVVERKQHDDAVQALQQEIEDIKKQWSKNLQLWLARGFTGAGALVVAISISAIFWAGLAAKKHIVGGVLAGMVSMAVGLAVGERWFLVAGRIVVGLLAASLIGWLFYLARTAIIERRTRLAIQDAKDEAIVGGEQAEKGWDWLKQHLMYRMPRTKTGDASAAEREIDRRLVAEGVNTTQT